MSDEEDMEVDVLAEEPAEPIEAPAGNAGGPDDSSASIAAAEARPDVPVKRGRGRPKKAGGSAPILPPGTWLLLPRFDMPVMRICMLSYAACKDARQRI